MVPLVTRAKLGYDPRITGIGMNLSRCSNFSQEISCITLRVTDNGLRACRTVQRTIRCISRDLFARRVFRECCKCRVKWRAVIVSRLFSIRIRERKNASEYGNDGANDGVAAAVRWPVSEAASRLIAFLYDCN